MSAKTTGDVWDIPTDQIERDEKYVLLAYVDHADHSGFNIFPSVALVARKTGYSERSVQAITKSLVKKGFLVEDGKGPKGTNKFRYGGVQKLRGAEIAGVQPTAPGGAKPTSTGGAVAIAPEPSGTVIEPSSRKPDLLDGMLAYSQSPGIKRLERINAIKSYIGERLRINTETKRWDEFAKFVDSQQQDGEKLEVFIAWMTSQKGFDIQYWGPNRMREMWPQAFTMKGGNMSGPRRSERL